MLQMEFNLVLLNSNVWCEIYLDEKVAHGELHFKFCTCSIEAIDVKDLEVEIWIWKECRRDLLMMYISFR